MKKFKQYEIKAKCLQEKSEIIGLFVGLGYKCLMEVGCLNILAFSDGCLLYIDDEGFNRTSYPQVTIEQLREMGMKEYLVKVDGEYVLRNAAVKPSGSIEVPEGAIKAYLNHSRTINFVNRDDDFMNSVTDGQWVDTHRGRHELSCHALVWQRNKTESVPSADEPNPTAWESQIGGSHYKDYAIQPLGFALANNLDAAQHAVVKYVMRHKDKNGIEDLKKAKHYIDLMIEHYY